MRRTSAALLLALALFGAAAGFGIQTLLAAMSLAKIRPEYTLALSLVIIAALIIALAVPVRRAVRGRGPNRRRIDPFYATRVVVLAKASSIAGALLGGAALGFLVDLLLRSAANGDTLSRILVDLGGSVVLLVAGLVAEGLCRVPPPDDDDDRHDGDPERVRL